MDFGMTQKRKFRKLRKVRETNQRAVPKKTAHSLSVMDLIDLAQENLLWQTPDGTAWITIDTPTRHVPITKPAFKRWLRKRCVRVHGSAPRTALLTEAIDHLEAIAFEGPTYSL